MTTAVLPRRKRVSVAIRALPKHVVALRHRGAAGGLIAQHRALKRVRLERRDRLAALGLGAGIMAIWIVLLPLVTFLWRLGFVAFARGLSLPGGVVDSAYPVGPAWLGLHLPTVAATAYGPSALTWWMTLIVVVIAFVVTFMLPDRLTPLAYFVRAAALLQCTALLFFLLRPDALAYRLGDYVATLLWNGLALITLTPVIFAFTYYVFDFGVRRKAALTAMTMLHLSIFVPLQAMLQAWIIYRFSSLFLPVLFMLGGLLLDVAVLIAFYGWGMSWDEQTIAGERLPAKATPQETRVPVAPAGQAVPAGAAR
jgi:hypothetical protein